MRALIVLALAVSAFARNDCVLLYTSNDVSEAVIACPEWPAGITRTLQAHTAVEWNALTGFDVKGAIVDTTKK